jgi:hypothetical protein
MQRVFRTLDQIELLDEGTPLDRLQRAEAQAASGLLGNRARDVAGFLGNRARP